MVDSAALGVVGAEDEAPDAEQADGLGAHWAGLQRDDQVAVGQAGAAAVGGGFAQGQDFGVRGGVVAGLGAVSGAGQNGPVRPQHDRTHGNFTARAGGTGFVQSIQHRVGGHGPIIAGCLRDGGIV